MFITKELTTVFNFRKKRTDSDGPQIMLLPLTQIAPNRNQPRRYFDEKAMEELAESIKEYGLIQPVTVRRIRGGYELIAGERRYRAAHTLGLTEIPAVIMDADTDKSAILALLENLQREDLSFFEIAESYRNLIRNRGITQTELAEHVGKSQSSVANKLRLLKLSPLVKKLIRDYNLSERHARALLSLRTEDEQVEVIRSICREKLNVAQTEELIKVMNDEGFRRDKNLRVATVKDIKVFKNTVNHALDVMKQGGIEAHMEEASFDWGTDYVIKIKNLY